MNSILPIAGTTDVQSAAQEPTRMPQSRQQPPPPPQGPPPPGAIACQYADPNSQAGAACAAQAQAQTKTGSVLKVALSLLDFEAALAEMS